MGGIRLLSCSPRTRSRLDRLVQRLCIVLSCDHHLEDLWILAVPVTAYCGADFQPRCGADWGGSIAWSTAIWYPEVVEKLVTCCGAHPELYFRNMDADQKKRCGIKCAGNCLVQLQALAYLPEQQQQL